VRVCVSGRALQQTCLNVWQGDDKNIEAAQQAFLERCRVNGEAQVTSLNP
jgi:fructose-bisphosphate aldolase class 1